MLGSASSRESEMHVSAPLDNGLAVAQKVRCIDHVTQNPSPGGSPGWDGVGVSLLMGALWGMLASAAS